MRIDEEVVQGRIDLIMDNLDVLEEMALMDAPEFTDSKRDVLAAKHALQESIESSLDIAGHIIAAKGFRRPRDYKDIFKVLREENIIDEKLSVRLQEMAKFRNLLVHQYSVIENQRVHEILREDVNDIKEYVKHVLVYVKNQKD